MPVDAPDAMFVRELTRRRAGIVLDDSKHYLINARLDAIASDHGFPDAPALISATRLSERLQTTVVEAMTTNETSFFRDNAPFECLRKHVLPQLIAARKTTRTLTLWSGACSTGQEPYSLAMMMLEHFGATLREWTVRIYATDFATAPLDRAKAGRFEQLEVNRGLPASMMVKYFERAGMEWVIRPAVRQLVTFSQLNLVEDWVRPRADVVLLRNVLIYFDNSTKSALLARMRRTLAEDGALFLGAGETTVNLDTSWTPTTADKTVYYRRTP